MLIYVVMKSIWYIHTFCTLLDWPMMITRTHSIMCCNMYSLVHFTVTALHNFNSFV